MIKLKIAGIQNRKKYKIRDKLSGEGGEKSLQIVLRNCTRPIPSRGIWRKGEGRLDSTIDASLSRVNFCSNCSG